MKIYVASKFENQTRVKEIAAQLEAAGHTITYKWWENTEVNPTQARADFWGVMFADALVFVGERDLHYCGALVEFGIALGRGIPIYLLGSALDIRQEESHWRGCIFTLLPEIRRTFDELLWNQVPD